MFRNDEGLLGKLHSQLEAPLKDAMAREVAALERELRKSFAKTEAEAVEAAVVTAKERWTSVATADEKAAAEGREMVLLREMAVLREEVAAGHAAQRVLEQEHHDRLARWEETKVKAEKTAAAAA